MAAVVKKIDPESPDRRLLLEAAEVLAGGGLAAFPTETVYGIAAGMISSPALERIFAVKGRSTGNPLPLMVAPGRLEQAAADLSPAAARLAARFWPGPLTLILPPSPIVPTIVTAGRPGVGVRIPAHPVPLGILEICPFPLAVTSANRSGCPSPTLAAHVLDDLGEEIDLLLDGGPAAVGIESTVVDLTVDPPLLRRPGPITRGDLEAAAGMPVALPEGVPGEDKQKRYVPRARVTLFSGDPRGRRELLRADVRRLAEAGEQVALLICSGQAPGETIAPAVRPDWDEVAGASFISLGPAGDSAGLAASFFRVLRLCDECGFSALLVDLPEGLDPRTGADANGLAAAVFDRMQAAAEGRVIRAEAERDR